MILSAFIYVHNKQLKISRNKTILMVVVPGCRKLNGQKKISKIQEYGVPCISLQYLWHLKAVGQS
uniref:Uncharacterized protein n=1 Tax=Rhizophora mucronata TaxID=61149 RepID=A0A2P2MAY4_RHIMU